MIRKLQSFVSNTFKNWVNDRRGAYEDAYESTAVRVYEQERFERKLVKMRRTYKGDGGTALNTVIIPPDDAVLRVLAIYLQVGATLANIRVNHNTFFVKQGGTLQTMNKSFIQVSANDSALLLGGRDDNYRTDASNDVWPKSGPIDLVPKALQPNPTLFSNDSLTIFSLAAIPLNHIWTLWCEGEIVPDIGSITDLTANMSGVPQQDVP